MKEIINLALLPNIHWILQTMADLVDRLPGHGTFIHYWFQYYNNMPALTSSSQDLEQVINGETVLGDYQIEDKSRFWKRSLGFMKAAGSCSSWNGIWTTKFERMLVVD